MTKGNLFMSLKGYFRCQFGYSLHGVLAKIILRSCVTRDGAICIKNVRFQYFDGTNPITGKGVSYSILQRFWVMLLVFQPRRLLVRNRMYTWLNKRSVLVLNISNKQRKNLQLFQVRQVGEDPRWKLLNFVGVHHPAKMSQLPYLHETNGS